MPVPASSSETPTPAASPLVTRLVPYLSAAITVVAATFAADLHLKLGLYLFSEQGLAFVLCCKIRPESVNCLRWLERGVAA